MSGPSDLKDHSMLENILMFILMLRMQVHFLISGQENRLCWGEGNNFFLSISLETMVNNCIAKWRLGAWDIQELPILITSQCSPEVLVAGIFAGYSCLEHRLLLLDKTTENDSLFFLEDNFECSLNLRLIWKRWLLYNFSWLLQNLWRTL